MSSKNLLKPQGLHPKRQEKTSNPFFNSKWKTLQNSYPIITPKGVALKDPNPK